MQVAVVLAIITGLEVLASYTDWLGRAFLPILLVLMIVKFFSVVLFFMHLRFDSKIFERAVLCGPVPRRRRLHRRPLHVPLLRRVTAGVSVLAQASLTADPFRFVWHPEVWLLVAFLIGAYVYMVRVIGPDAVPFGQPPVSRRQGCYFVAAMLMLWAASDWPIHDLGEQYLYSVHMLQHMMLSYFLPPLVLLATPEWLLRTLIGNGRVYSAVRWLCRPIAAGIIFNMAVMVTHVPGVVNASVESGPLHYGLHVLVVTTSLLMWMPVVGPFPEFRIGPAAATIYLFLQSVVPTVPAGWLVFAEGTRLQALRRTAGPRVGDQPDRRPADRRGDHEGRRQHVPVDDRGLRVLHEGRVLVRRVAQLPARCADADRRDHRPRRSTAHDGRRRAGVRPRAGHTGTGLTRPHPDR